MGSYNMAKLIIVNKGVARHDAFPTRFLLPGVHRTTKTDTKNTPAHCRCTRSEQRPLVESRAVDCDRPAGNQHSKLSNVLRRLFRTRRDPSVGSRRAALPLA